MNLSVEPVTARCNSTGVWALPSSPMYSQPSLAGCMKSTWTVESRLPGFLIVGDACGVERLAQLFFGPRPLGIVGYVLGHVLVAQRELNPIVGEPVGVEDFAHYLQSPGELFLDLILRAEHVCVVLGKAPHPRQPRELSALLEAVQSGELRVPEREIPVGVRL